MVGNNLSENEMTDYLKVAKECGFRIYGEKIQAPFSNEDVTELLEVFSARILTDKEAELKNVFAEIQHNQATLIRDYQQQLSESQALIAMQAEALKEVDDDAQLGRGSRLSCGHGWPCGCSHSKALKALSASAETVAAWEARELEPLRREVAMLRHTVGAMIHSSTNMRVKLASDALNDTQATAEAYEKEVAQRGAAKSLEEANSRLERKPVQLARRNTESLSGWINELGLLSKHHEPMAGWLRDAIRNIWIGLSKHQNQKCDNNNAPSLP